MKASTLKYAVLSWMSALATLIILLMPFHAFLTIWASTFVGHYTALRLWKEALLLVCCMGVLFLLATDHKIRSHTLSRRLVWLILAFGVLNGLWGALAFMSGDVTLKALGYGLIVDLRFLVFFLVTWALALRLARMRARWQWIVLAPAVIVVAFGLIQQLLPPRFLEHFGYSMYTILPFQYVDSQPELLRGQSTLRGANPFGAYLVIIICLIAELLLNRRATKHKKKLLAFGAAALVAIYFTYSRSAWIGLVVSLCVLAVVTIGPLLKKKAIPIIAASLIILVALTTAAIHNDHVQTTLLHADQDSESHITSNEARSEALLSGLRDLAHHPLGSGPGTAGPASVYNDHPARISESFFLQIGQETGWLGLGLFLLINAGVGYLLWLRRSDPLALSLFASLIGLTIVNMLSHAWADDTLAYIWWGLAGIAMAHLPKLAEKPDDKEAK